MGSRVPGRRSVFLSEGAENERRRREFVGGSEMPQKCFEGAENERRRREFVGGSWGIPPQKCLKSRGSEILREILLEISISLYVPYTKIKTKKCHPPQNWGG